MSLSDIDMSLSDLVLVNTILSFIAGILVGMYFRG